MTASSLFFYRCAAACESPFKPIGWLIKETVKRHTGKKPKRERERDRERETERERDRERDREG